MPLLPLDRTHALKTKVQAWPDCTHTCLDISSVGQWPGPEDASDWLKVITWPGYWPLIGRYQQCGPVTEARRCIRLLRIGNYWELAREWPLIGSRAITWPRYWPLIGWLGSHDLASDWELENWPTDSAFLSLKLVSKLNRFNISFRNFAAQDSDRYILWNSLKSSELASIAQTTQRNLHAFYFSYISEKPQSEVQESPRVPHVSCYILQQQQQGAFR